MPFAAFYQEAECETNAACAGHADAWKRIFQKTLRLDKFLP